MKHNLFQPAPEKKLKIHLFNTTYCDHWWSQNDSKTKHTKHWYFKTIFLTWGWVFKVLQGICRVNVGTIDLQRTMDRNKHKAWKTRKYLPHTWPKWPSSLKSRAEEFKSTLNNNLTFGKCHVSSIPDISYNSLKSI